MKQIPKKALICASFVIMIMFFADGINLFSAKADTLIKSPCGSYGDINNDGYVTSDDSTLLQEYIVGNIALTDEQKKRADVKGDGTPDIGDATLIKRYAIGEITTFSVCTVTPSVTVLSPNGREVWMIGGSYDIKWASQNLPAGQDITVSIAQSGTKTEKIIFSSVSNDIDIARWTIPSDISVGSYVLLVSAPGLSQRLGVKIDDGSDAEFRIAAAGANLPPVIDSLAGPAQLKVNEIGTWTIKASDPENGTLIYSVRWGDEAYYSTIEQRAFSSGAGQTTTFTHSYSKLGNYTINLTVADDKSQSAKSSITVAVVAETKPSITVLSPNGGEAWKGGENYLVNWKVVGITRVDIELENWGNPPFAGGPLTYVLGTNISAVAPGGDGKEGNYFVTLPSGVNSSYFKIRVVDITTKNLPYFQQSADSSDNYFSVETRISPCGSYGDLDDDGYVTQTDENLMKKLSVGKITLADNLKMRADLNGNGEYADVGDLVLIKKFLLSEITTFPVPACTITAFPIKVGVIQFGEMYNNADAMPVLNKFKEFIEGNSKLKLDISIVKYPPLSASEVPYIMMSGPNPCYWMFSKDLTSEHKALIPRDTIINIVIWNRIDLNNCWGGTQEGLFDPNGVNLFQPFISIPAGWSSDLNSDPQYTYAMVGALIHEFENALFGILVTKLKYPAYSDNTKGFPSIEGCGSYGYNESNDPGWLSCRKFVLSKITDQMYVALRDYVPTPGLFTGSVSSGGATTSGAITTSTNCVVPDGTLVKLPDDSKVYVIKNCVKIWIPTAEAFEKSGYKWGDIKIDSGSVIKSVGSVVLVRANGDSRVYVIVNNAKRHIPTVEAFNLSGYKWNDVAVLSKTEVDYYPDENILATYADGTLIRAFSASEVYVIKNGKKVWIPTANDFINAGYKWNNIVIINKAEVDSLP